MNTHCNEKKLINAQNCEFTVYANPTESVFHILGDTVRFTADNNSKTVYMWSFSSGHHSDVSVGLELKDSYSCPDFFRGAAVMKNRKYRFAASDFLSSFRKNPGENDRLFLTHMFSKDWSWVDDFIVLSPYIDKMKQIFNLGQKHFIYD
jgi:hypothetical protein